MPRLVAIAAFALTILPTTTVAFAAWSWRDTTRDVYVDGQIDRAARVWRSETMPLLAVSISSDKAIWLIGARGPTFPITRCDRRQFASVGIDLETVAQPSGKAAGTGLVVSDENWLFSAAGRTILITPHRGPDGGPITEEQIYDWVPIWRSLRDAYTPDPVAVASLKRIDRPTQLVVAFGTWCGDSKRNLPRLLKTLSVAQNQQISLRLVAVNRGFTAPLSFIDERELTNVPTIIAERDGHELGRIVENPGRPTIEAELASLLTNEAVLPDAAGDRGAELAHGRYEWRAADGALLAEESFTLFERAGIAHAVVLEATRARDGQQSETVLQTDADRAPTFAQVTRFGPTGRTRLRASFDHGALSVTARGVPGGTIQQTVASGDRPIFAAPSFAALGLQWSTPPAHELADRRRYVLPEPLAAAVGSLTRETALLTGTESVPNRFDIQQTVVCVTHEQAGVSTWWLHPTLGVPVAARLADGSSLVLVEFATP